MALSEVLWADVLDIAIPTEPFALATSNFGGYIAAPRRDYFAFDITDAELGGLRVIRDGADISLGDLFMEWTQRFRLHKDTGHTRNNPEYFLETQRRRYLCVGLQLAWPLLSLLLVGQLAVLAVPDALPHGKLPNCNDISFFMGPVDIHTVQATHRSQDELVIDYNAGRFATAAKWLRGQLVEPDDDTNDLIGMQCKNETLLWLDTMARFGSNTKHAHAHVMFGGMPRYSMEALVVSLRICDKLKGDNHLMDSMELAGQYLGMQEGWLVENLDDVSFLPHLQSGDTGSHWTQPSPLW